MTPAQNDQYTRGASFGVACPEHSRQRFAHSSHSVRPPGVLRGKVVSSDLAAQIQGRATGGEGGGAAGGAG